MTLLGLPGETRLQILQELLSNRTIKVEAEVHEDPLGNGSAWAMKNAGGLHTNILCTCRQIAEEGQSLVYTSNVFDCSQREGPQHLLARIGRSNFSQIRHLILEWDQLQDLRWMLVKDDGSSCFRGLETVTTATWRTRVLGGTSCVWQQNKSYERQLCQAAKSILERHPKLSLLVQVPYRREMRRTARSHDNYRVKWRFLTAEQTLHADETAVDLEQELGMLHLKRDEGEMQPAQMTVDPL